MSDRVVSEDEARIWLAEWIVFGESDQHDPDVLDAVTDLATRYDNDPATIEAALAPEIKWYKDSVRYARWQAGLPRMEPPSFTDVARIYEHIAGKPLTIMGRDN